jgi:hypothetical protein
MEDYQYRTGDTKGEVLYPDGVTQAPAVEAVPVTVFDDERFRVRYSQREFDGAVIASILELGPN